MDKFFNARSVAVVGVSNSAKNLGRVMAYNLMEFRYQGSMYLVGPRGGAFLGHKIYPTIMDLPERVELATVLVPAAAVPEVLRQCGEEGIRRVVVQSAGFRELGEERLDLEKQILEIIERYQLRMIGPNCIGIMNRHNGLAVPFMPFKAEARPGSVAIVSQSGGVGGTMVNVLAGEHIGFSKFASIGNKLNVNETDLLEYLGNDPETDTIYCYLEGIAQGRRLMEVAFRCSKPIVAHKSNCGESGAVIARSHSASLSTDDQVVAAAMKQCGIVRAREQHEALQMLKAVMLPPMPGNRLAVISRSGGHAVMAADAAEELGFSLPPYPEELIRQVQEHSRANVIAFHNPLDLGDLFDIPLYRSLVENTLRREDIDGVLFIHNYQGIFDAEDSRRLLASLAELMPNFAKPVAVCLFTMRGELDWNREAVNFPIFTDPRQALRALAWNRDRNRCRPRPFASERPGGVEPATVRSALTASEAGPVPPQKLAVILAAYGLPLISWKEATTEDDAVSAARSLGFPVVLKTANPEVLHKTDSGGVLLNLNDGAAVRLAYRDLQVMGPSVLIQKMSQSGLEWFVGGRQDQQFGPVVIVGLGGIYVEVFKETGLRIGPIDEQEAERMVDECRGAILLSGVRGEPPLDRQTLVDAIVRISWLLNDFPEIKELDLNPVRVFQRGCQVLDWRATLG